MLPWRYTNWRFLLQNTQRWRHRWRELQVILHYNMLQRPLQSTLTVSSFESKITSESEHHLWFRTTNSLCPLHSQVAVHESTIALVLPVLTYLLTYLLTYSLTHCMMQDIIWKADSHSACQNYPAFFMEPEGSLPCSQKPAMGPYPEPAEYSSPHRSLSP